MSELLQADMPKPDLPGVEVWRGGVTPWQCDEMGHMNVRFYLAAANEGLANLAALMGMPRAFTPGASSTLLLQEHHVRFLKEARPGAGLVMTGGVLAMGESTATLLLLLFHASGEPAAAITAKVMHVTPRDMRAFPWTRAAREMAPELTIQAPEFALARSVPQDPVTTGASLKAADDLGLDRAATGAVTQADCDVFGRMLPEQVLARIYASVGHILRGSQEAMLKAQPDLEGRLGGAAVEYRVIYHAWPGAGARLEMRSGHRDLTPKYRRVIHWLLDPTSGRPWATAEMVSLFLDLKARRSLTVADSTLAVMGIEPIPSLGL